MTNQEPTNREVLDAVQNNRREMLDEVAKLSEVLGQHSVILDGLQKHTLTIDQRFEAIDQRFETIDQRFEAIDRRFDQVDKQFEDMTEMIQGLASHLNDEIRGVRADMATKADTTATKTELAEIRAQMVTKEYFDEKLLDLRSDLVVMARKSNRKLEVLIEELVAEKRLPAMAARKILLMEPFPQA